MIPNSKFTIISNKLEKEFKILISLSALCISIFILQLFRLSGLSYIDVDSLPVNIIMFHINLCNVHV